MENLEHQTSYIRSSESIPGTWTEKKKMKQNGSKKKKNKSYSFKIIYIKATCKSRDYIPDSKERRDSWALSALSKKCRWREIYQRGHQYAKKWFVSSPAIHILNEVAHTGFTYPHPNEVAHTGYAYWQKDCLLVANYSLSP